MTEILALTCVITLLFWAAGASIGWWHTHRHDIDPNELLQHHFESSIREDS